MFNIYLKKVQNMYFKNVQHVSKKCSTVYEKDIMCIEESILVLKTKENKETQ